MLCTFKFIIYNLILITKLIKQIHYNINLKFISNEMEKQIFYLQNVQYINLKLFMVKHECNNYDNN